MIPLQRLRRILAWVDHVLGIRETAHVDLSTLDYDYDFRVFDSPDEVRRLIEARNDETGRARMVAGCCWRWKSKKDPEAWDVVIDEQDFRMRWNLTHQGPGWLGYPESINEIGCIHACQGLDPVPRCRSPRQHREGRGAGLARNDDE